MEISYSGAKFALLLNKEKCLEKLEQLKQEIGIVQHNNSTADMPFGEWIDFWYNQYAKITLRPTTQSEYESLIYKHIIPEIGKIELNKLSQNDLQQFYSRLRQMEMVCQIEW